MEEKIIFKVSNNDLLHHLQRVSKAVLDKSTLPVYTYILFELNSDKTLRLTGNTTEIQIETSLQVIDTDNSLTFCVDKSIINILMTLPEHPVEFEVTRAVSETDPKSVSVTIELRHSKGNAVIPGMDATYFEKMKSVTGQSFKMPIESLRRGLNMTKKFAGTDAMKPTQSAVYFDLKDDHIVFVSTDGAYMSRLKDMSVKCSGCRSFILGLSAAAITSSLVEKISNEEIEVMSSESNVSFSFLEIKITARLVEGRYPNYNSIFPTNNSIEMNVDSDYLSSVLKRLLIVSNPLVGMIKLESGMIDSIISTQDEFSNKSAKETIGFGSNENIAIGFNGPKMIDVLSVINRNAILQFSVPEKPILIKPEKDEADTELTLLLMPFILR